MSSLRVDRHAAGPAAPPPSRSGVVGVGSPAARVAPAERDEGARFREEERVGFIVRSATEVEARSAGLAPGAGVVLVGLAAGSPWRGYQTALERAINSGNNNTGYRSPTACAFSFTGP